MKKIKGCLTMLADNIVAGKVNSLAENGFSACIETESGNLLFDTGRGSTIIHNALVYKKKLDLIDKLILSHGHADHSGGLPEVLRFHEKLQVFGHPDIFLDRFRGPEGGEKKYGGIPYTRGYLEKCGADFILNTEFTDIDRCTYLTGEVPRITDFENGDRDNRQGIRDGRVVVDEILDDQSLIISAESGIIILLGCAHSGVINIINHAINMTGSDNLFAIIGGTHLGYTGERQVEKTIQALKSYKIKHFIPAHCTGLDVAVRLVGEFPSICKLSSVGTRFEF